jgi:hypothetical protein
MTPEGNKVSTWSMYDVVSIVDFPLLPVITH